MITIVTGNTTKFHEMQEALLRHDIHVQRQSFDIPEEQTLDAESVVREKALAAYSEVQAPILVDDSGFYMEKYNEFPGVFSKYVYKSIGFDGLFKLADIGDRAEFRTYIAYMDAQCPTPQIFTGHYTGSIVDGFDMTIDYEMPFAPMFQPDDSDGKRMSEMTPEERSYDHRHSALQLFAQWYNVNRPKSCITC